MTAHQIGIAVVRHQDMQGRCLRVHLYYHNDQPIEPELVTALRQWDQLRPIPPNEQNPRAAVGQLSASRLFVDMARADDLRPPHHRKRRASPDPTPSELRRQTAIGDRIWRLEQWLLRWYGIGNHQGAEEDSLLIVAMDYPTRTIHRFESGQLQRPKQ